MTIDLTKEENDVMGPIAYLVVEFPNNEKLTGEGQRLQVGDTRKRIEAALRAKGYLK